MTAQTLLRDLTALGVTLSATRKYGATYAGSGRQARSLPVGYLRWRCSTPS
jgi:hypothetical protein